MIGIVDYGMGNLLSVKNALDYLGEDNVICSEPAALASVDKIILPGVGAFPDSMRNLHARGLVDALHEQVLVQRKPVLGICLGMQIMARLGFEQEETAGLGWFDADVVLMQPGDSHCKVPNVGWQEVSYRPGSPLFRQFPLRPDFYFVHSYHLRCADEADLTAWYTYGQLQVTAAIQRGHIFGTQFHPEKSSDFGHQLLINFLDYHG